MNREILFIDTETGGLDPNNFSIISFAAVLWRDKEICESMQVFIYEDPFVSEPESLKINNIDVDWLRENGVSASDAVLEITQFIAANANMSAGKLQLAGHNVGFDVGFLKRLFRLGGGNFDSNFTHRTIDTSAILSFLSLGKKLDIDSPSSSKAFSHFGIESAPGERHTALGDALATAELFNHLVSIVQ